MAIVAPSSSNLIAFSRCSRRVFTNSSKVDVATSKFPRITIVPRHHLASVACSMDCGPVLRRRHARRGKSRTADPENILAPLRSARRVPHGSGSSPDAADGGARSSRSQTTEKRRSAEFRITPMKNLSTAGIILSLVLAGCSGDQASQQRAPRAVSYLPLTISEPGTGSRPTGTLESLKKIPHSLC